MILQKITLPFDAGTADTIYTKQGETGRGVWFDLPFLIGEEEIPDYKAEFIAIKPDDTFVIEDATLTNHGDGDDLHSVCYLTLPEQVSAAKGTGSYILKVYDYVHDNDLIYSAAGGLYVDDHLLLDSMIESIAEVNGYNFPDDFLTIGDLGAIINDNVTAEDTTWSSHKIDDEITDAAAALQDDIDGLIDDNSTSADTTWSSQKIDSEIDTSALEIYRTSERLIGKWIDNKDLYERTFTADLPTAIPVGSNLAYEIINENIGSEIAFFVCGIVNDLVAGRVYSLPYDRYYSATDKLVPEVFTDDQGRLQIFVTAPAAAGFTLSHVSITVRYTKS